MQWGYYVTYAKESLTALTANVGAFTHIAPYYFMIQADGSIKSLEEPDTNNLLRLNRVKILPMIKNDVQGARFTPMIGTPEVRDALAASITNLVVSKGYDGINIDFEDIRPEDRPLLSDFMVRLAGKMRPAGKLVSQAVVAKTKDAMTGYGGAFDYPALSPSLDYAVVMAYDYHYAGGDAGPVAPIDWVRNVATYSASTFGPAKVVLGMPLYGYDWDITSGDTARAISYRQALTRSKYTGATRTLDFASGSEVVRYRDDSGDQHEAWFESAATFAAKLRVVKEAGLAGFGVWRIGQEDSNVWDVLRRDNTPSARSYSLGEDNASHKFFNETGHNLSNAFKAYFDANGGVARFGLPLTEEFTERNTADDKVYTIQYFERARFEYNSDLGKVQLGQLGTEVFPAHGKIGNATLEAPANLPPDKQYFPETKHVVAGSFKQYYDQKGGLAQFGFPISEEVAENGKTVQYFQRARLEYNPAGLRWKSASDRPARYRGAQGSWLAELTPVRVRMYPNRPLALPDSGRAFSCELQSMRRNGVLSMSDPGLGCVWRTTTRDKERHDGSTIASPRKSGGGATHMLAPGMARARGRVRQHHGHGHRMWRGSRGAGDTCNAGFRYHDTGRGDGSDGGDARCSRCHGNSGHCGNSGGGSGRKYPDRDR